MSHGVECRVNRTGPPQDKMEKAGVKLVHYLVTAGAVNAMATAQGKKKKNQCVIFTTRGSTDPQLTHVHRTGGGKEGVNSNINSILKTERISLLFQIYTLVKISFMYT